ncbi:MAG: DUF4190 domain-containing protein [Candidatus Geothermincolia bacterium]
MKFCNECGQGNADDAGFCVQCGTQIPSQEGAQPVVSSDVGAPAPPGQTPPPPQVQQGLTPPPPGFVPPPTMGVAPPPPGPGVPPPGYPAYNRPLPVDGMAIASLVAGIVAWVFCPVIAAVLAVVFGYIAKRNIKESNGALGGEGFATAGIILGFVHLGLTLLVVIAIVIIALATGTHSNTFNMINPTLLAALTLV